MCASVRLNFNALIQSILTTLPAPVTGQHEYFCEYEIRVYSIQQVRTQDNNNNRETWQPNK